jgi:Lon protease-like protein
MTPTSTDHPPTEFLPALALAERVMLPGSRCCVELTSVSSYGAAREATRAWDVPLVAVFSTASGAADDLSSVGVVATVTDLRKLGTRWVADLRGVSRVRRRALTRRQPFRVAAIQRWPEPTPEGAVVSALAAAVHGAVGRSAHPLACLLTLVREQLRGAVAWEIPGVVMPLLDQVPWTAWQSLLEHDTVEQRLAFVLAHLEVRRAPPAG